jgi:hypothetical protein
MFQGERVFWKLLEADDDVITGSIHPGTLRD